MTQITVKENNKDYYKARIDCCMGKFYCQAGNPVKRGIQNGSPARGLEEKTTNCLGPVLAMQNHVGAVDWQYQCLLVGYTLG